MITLNYWINQIADMPVCQNGVWVDLRRVDVINAIDEVDCRDE